jgi:hypothetical protein
MKHGRLVPELVTNEEYPDIAINNSVRDAMLSGETLEKAKDFAFLSPEAYARKWDNPVADPVPDPLPAEQAESIANLGAGQGTDEAIMYEIEMPDGSKEQHVIGEAESPEETGFSPDLSDDPANQWQPRDMKTTVITRDNIDHFNNPFA